MNEPHRLEPAALVAFRGSACQDRVTLAMAFNGGAGPADRGQLADAKACLAAMKARGLVYEDEAGWFRLAGIRPAI